MYIYTKALKNVKMYAFITKKYGHGDTAFVLYAVKCVSVSEESSFDGPNPIHSDINCI